MNVISIVSDISFEWSPAELHLNNNTIMKPWCKLFKTKPLALKQSLIHTLARRMISILKHTLILHKQQNSTKSWRLTVVLKMSGSQAMYSNIYFFPMQSPPYLNTHWATVTTQLSGRSLWVSSTANRKSALNKQSRHATARPAVPCSNLGVPAPLSLAYHKRAALLLIQSQFHAFKEPDAMIQSRL